MFTSIGHIWRPKRRTFTLVGNVCPLTRIAITAIVPLREPIPIASNIDKPVVTLVYSRKYKEAKKKVPVCNPKINKSLVANEMEPKNSWGSISSNVPSSLIKCRLSKLFSELTNEEIRNSNAYKEYYAIATGSAPPKPKANVLKTRSSSDTSITPPTVAAATPTPITTIVADPMLTAAAKGKQLARAKSVDDQEKVGDDDEGDEGNDRKQGEEDNDGGDDGEEGEEDDDDAEQEVSKNDDKDDTEESGDDDEEGDDDDDDLEVERDDDKDDEEEGGDDDQEYDEDEYDEETRDEESFDPIPKTPKNNDDEGNGKEDIGLNVGEEERHAEEEEEDELYRDVNINQERENDEFLKTVDENMKKIIKEQVKEQVKTSYVVAADLLEMELKKILIKKMECNKSIQRSDEQRNLYKALDEEPSAGQDRGSKRRREGKEPELASTLTETHPEWFSQQQKPPTPNHDWNKTLPAIHESIQSWISELAKQTDSRSSFNELMDTPLNFSNFLINRLKYPHNLLKPLPLIPNNCRRVIPFEYFINNDLEYLCGGSSSREYTTSIMKTKAADYRHMKWIEDLVPRTMWIEEPIGYDKHALWGVSHWERKQWHSYKHLDWITIRRDNDKLYKFKEGDFKRLRIQDIEDMLLLLVQGKLTNLTIKERFAFNVSLRMFTRSIVIQRRMKDLQLGVESYQKKLNLTKPDLYRSDLKCKEAYTAYSNPRGFIY
nr:hypothetical protein [Tanacetum cinerariifolium]